MESAYSRRGLKQSDKRMQIRILDWKDREVV
jgi:hypothetical protein